MYMKKREILRKNCKEWMEKTTGHAMANIVGTDIVILKIIWLIAWLIGLGLTIFLITQSLIDYYSYQVVSQSKIVNQRPMLFPKVTFCNIDPFSSNYSVTYLANVIRNEAKFANKVTASGAITDLDLVNYFVLNEENLLEVSKLQVRNENDTTKISLGHSKTEFIIQCLYDNVECSIENDFQYEYNERLGNCYTFNFDKNNIKRSFNSGKSKGLQVVLYIGKDNNYETLSDSTGVRVFTYNHSTLYSESEGNDASSEKETNIAVFKKISNTLEVPYSSCKVSDSDGLKLEGDTHSEYVDLFTKSGYRYRTNDCDNICYQNEVYKVCGCVDLHMKFDNIENINVTRFCNHKINTTDSLCLEKLLITDGEAFHNLCSKKCPLECDSTLYTFSGSFSIFPTDSSYSRLKSSSVYINSEHTKGSVQKKLLKINVFFNEMDYEHYTESPAMTVQGLLGNLGGTLGLFLGFSVLSTIEIFEFIINCVTELRKRKEIQNKVSHTG